MKASPPVRPHVLYLVPRTDLQSMNAGKMAAQACHGQRYADSILGCPQGTALARSHGWSDSNHAAYQDWCRETPQGFGTTIVLAGGTCENLHAVVSEARALGLAAGVVHDPSYPVQDGSVFHHIPLDTVAWVFVPSPGIASCRIGTLELYP